MSKRLTIDLANPLVIYSFEWIVVLGLTALRITDQMVPMHQYTVGLVAANLAIFAVIYGVFALIYRPSIPSERLYVQPHVQRLLKKFVWQLLAVWAVGSVVEIIASGGLPILWVLMGRTDLDYRNFGIFTVHGFLTGCYLVALVGVYMQHRIEQRRKTLLLLGLLMLWPLVSMSRGLMTWVVLELTGLHLIFYRVGVGRLVRLFVLAMVLIIAFGIVGDLRMGERRVWLRTVVRDEYRPIMDRLPSGFLWVYIYATSPLNNVNAGIGKLEPSYVLYYSTANLIPTFIRARLYAGEKKYPLQLKSLAFNTSTWYANFLSDFGIPGALFFTSLLQFFAVVIYLRAREGEAWAMLAFAPIFEGLALSVFADLFTSLVTLVQVVLAGYFGVRVAREAKRLAEEQSRAEQ